MWYFKWWNLWVTINHDSIILKFFLFILNRNIKQLIYNYIKGNLERNCLNPRVWLHLHRKHLVCRLLHYPNTSKFKHVGYALGEKKIIIITSSLAERRLSLNNVNPWVQSSSEKDEAETPSYILKKFT